MMYPFFVQSIDQPPLSHIPACSKVGLISAFCPINRFCTRTTFLGKPEFLLIYCCQARFSAAKMPDQTAKIPDQTAEIPDHVGWQFLTTAFIFRNGVVPQERRQCFWATADFFSPHGRSRYSLRWAIWGVYPFRQTPVAMAHTKPSWLSSHPFPKEIEYSPYNIDIYNI